MVTDRPLPLVLLHGIGQSPIVWQDFVSAFGAGRPMNAPWLHGLRPGDPVGFDLGAAADALADTLELEGIERADLVGVSVGASVALRLAAARPDLVGRLVLAGALVRPSRAALMTQKLALRVVPERRLLDAGVSRARTLAVIDSLKGFDATTQLASVQAATLVVAGSRDRAGVAAARQLAGALPAGEVRVVDGAGPVLNVDAARELADLTHDFLDDGAAGASGTAHRP